jgi:hypothetical protein
MFKDDKTAYRAVLAITKRNDVMTNEITMAEAMPTAPQYFGDKMNKVTDRHAHSSNGIVLGAGLEKRRGSGRLQGFYGGELLVAIQGATKHKYEYGNALTQNAQGDQPNVNPNNATYSTDRWGQRTGNLVTGGNINQHVGVTSARVLQQ